MYWGPLEHVPSGYSTSQLKHTVPVVRYGRCENAAGTRRGSKITTNCVHADTLAPYATRRSIMFMFKDRQRHQCFVISVWSGSAQLVADVIIQISASGCSETDIRAKSDRCFPADGSKTIDCALWSRRPHDSSKTEHAFVHCIAYTCLRIFSSEANRSAIIRNLLTD